MEQTMGQQRYLTLWVLVASLLCSGGAKPLNDPLLHHGAAPEVKLPFGFIVCTVNDPSFENCLLQAAEKNREVLNNGYPDFRIPPLHPIYLDRIVTEMKYEPLFSLVVEQRDLSVEYDFDSFLEVEFDEDRRRFSVVALLNEMHVHGRHTSQGNSRFGPIHGHGPIHTTLKGLTVRFEVSYSLYQRNNKDHMHLDSLTVQLEPEHMHVDFEGALDQPWHDSMFSSMLNRDWEKYLLPTLPSVERQLGDALKKNIEGLFYHLPYRTLFPE